MEAVRTIFMMVFGMTRSGREPTTYRVRGAHANHLANPTRSQQLQTTERNRWLEPDRVGLAQSVACPPLAR